MAIVNSVKGMVNTMPKRLVLYSAVIGGGVGAYILWRRRKTSEDKAEPTDEATGPSAIDTEGSPYRGPDSDAADRELPYAPGSNYTGDADQAPGSIYFNPVFNLPPGTTGGGPPVGGAAIPGGPYMPPPKTGEPQKAIPLTQSELEWLAKYQNTDAKKLTNAQRLRRARLSKQFAAYNKYALAAAKAQVQGKAPVAGGSN